MYQWCKAGPPHPLRAWSVVMCTQFTPPTPAQTCFYMCLNTRREQHKHSDKCRLSAHCRNTGEISCEAFWEQCADCQRCILSVILSSFSLKWIWDSQVDDLVPALSTTVGAKAVETCWELFSIGLDVHLFFSFFNPAPPTPDWKWDLLHQLHFHSFLSPRLHTLKEVQLAHAVGAVGVYHCASVWRVMFSYVVLAVGIKTVNAWHSCCSTNIRHSVRISGQCGGERGLQVFDQA